MKRIAKLTAFALLCTLLITCLALVPSAAKLTDIEGHWAKEYIEYGVEKGYISGYPDGTFLPNKTVTRAEFSKMLNSAAKITGTAKTSFKDVPADQWYAEEVKKAVYAAYTTGYDDNTFRPNGNITRQEAAVFLARVTLPIKERADLNSFKDSSSIDSWAEDAVSMIAAKGYIKGDEEERFLPKGQLTRSQAAKLIAEFVQNENIVNVNRTIDKSTTLSETLFTGNVTVDTEEAAEVIFENCRVLGTVSIRSEAATVELENTGINTLENNALDTSIIADSNAEIKTANIYYPTTITCSSIGNVYLSGTGLSGETVTISGKAAFVDVATNVILKASNVDKLNISKKVNLVIQQGKIAELVVSASAKNSTINLSTSRVTVTNVVNNAAVSYIGDGNIINANNVVSGVEYENQPENITGKDSEDSENKNEDEDEKEDEDEDDAAALFTKATFSPTKGKTNVDVGTKIVVTFKSAIKNNKNKVITSDYLEDTLELRKLTASGSQIDFEATYASSSNRITIVPTEDLDPGKKYYLVFPKDAFTDSNGNKTARYASYYFTTASDDEEDEEDDSGITITFDPANNDDDVKVDQALKITFSEKIYNASGKAITSSNVSYLESTAIELRKSNATSGTKIDFNATISSTGKIVTITPEEDLEPETTYYLIIVANKLENSKGKAISRKYAKFTTVEGEESGAEITVIPANGSKNISSMPDITITFSEVMLKYNRKDLSNDDPYFADEVFEIRLSNQTTGAHQGVYVKEYNANSKKVVINPVNTLEANKTYYLIIKKDSLIGKESGKSNEKVVSSFTVAPAMAPMITPVNGTTGVAVASNAVDIRVDFSEKIYYVPNKTTNNNTSGAVTNSLLASYPVVYLKRDSATGANVACDQTISSDGKTIYVTPRNDLATNRTYYVVVNANVVQNGTGTSGIKKNTAATSYFRTMKEFVPEFSPKDGDSDVALDATLKIDFGETLKAATNATLNSVYLTANVVELYKTNKSNPVDFIASISSDKKVISVKPNEKLESDTTYILVLNSGTLKNSEGDVNPGDEISFTTSNDVDTNIEVKPAHKAVNVSTSVEPVIKFASPVYCYSNLDTVDDDYASQAIVLYEGTKQEINKVTGVTVSVENSRNFTISGYTFKPGTTYHIVIQKEMFRYSNEKAVAEKNFQFTTTKTMPELTVTSKTSTENTITATFNIANLTGSTTARVDIEAVPVGGGSAKTTFKSYKTGTGHTITLPGLESGKNYRVTLMLTVGGIEVTETFNIATKAPIPECEYCDEVHDTSDHVCGICGKKGHPETDDHCADCGNEWGHKATDAHCGVCGDYGHADADCPDAVVCEYCSGAHESTEHECATCGEKGHADNAAHCGVCSKYGHADADCPDAVVCEYCSGAHESTEHECATCGEKGHADNAAHCGICSKYGHADADCPDASADPTNPPAGN